MSEGTRRTARSRAKPSPDEDSLHNFKQRNPRARIRNNSSIRLMEVNLKLLLGFGFLAFLAIVFVIHNHFKSEDQTPKLRVTTPLNAPKMMDLPQFQGKHKESLYWGTYRSQVYLGIRARTPKSLIAGLMWIGVKNGQYFLRHVCQHSDDLSTYGWTEHNGRDYGHQVLVDQDLAINTTFLKSQEESSGYGGDWAVRFDVGDKKTSSDGKLSSIAHLFFYMADEGGYALTVDKEAPTLHKGTSLISGSREDVGSWELHLDSLDDMDVHYSGYKTTYFHNLTELIQDTLAFQARRTGHLQLPDTSEVSSNIIVFQISAKLPFKMDIAFVSGSGLDNSRVEERVNSLTGALLTQKLNEKQKDFEDRYRRIFNLTDKVDSESMVVGRAAIGNLLGGIGYFYGQSKIALPTGFKHQNGDNFAPYWPAALYTAVPSRSFFPRGFLWDEGFHQLLIWRWDIGICLDIIGHWLDLMNIDGWIPREQILGAEALSKVPEEFVLQHPTNGNPPTLFLVLRDLIIAAERKMFNSTEGNDISAFLERAFPRIVAWFQWFNTTQLGKDPSSYYWHGRDKETTRELNPKTLSSGLDDYPRASHPSGEERHLDLRCWMLLAANCIHSISELLQLENGFAKGYQSMAEQLSNFKILNQLHLDDVSGAYYDFGNHTEKVSLRWHEIKGSSSTHASRELVRVVSEVPQLSLVPHVGYVSLFPFMMKIIPPESWILEKQLDLISNRSTLWTNYGLRSLAKTSSMYMKRNTEHDPPYWRGPIWINMNYMILSALHHYSREDGPYRVRAGTIYKELRENLIRNIVHKYFESGFLWEQYDQKKSGKGKGTHPFTGWTSLVVLIMAEAY